MSIVNLIADVAPEPTFALGSTGSAIAIVVVALVAVALLLWCLRSRGSKTAAATGAAAAPPRVDPSTTSRPAAAPADVSTEAGLEPPFDADKALGLCGDDEELLRTVIEELPEEIDSQMKILHEALGAEDTGTLHVSAHRLKGSLLLIAAAPSAALALAIELAGRQSNLAAVPKKLDELDVEVARLKRAIAEHLAATATS